MVQHLYLIVGTYKDNTSREVMFRQEYNKLDALLMVEYFRKNGYSVGLQKFKQIGPIQKFKSSSKKLIDIDPYISNGKVYNRNKEVTK